MPGIKGRTNNPAGRPPDHKVRLYRETIRDKQIERIENLYKQLDALTGKDYIEYYLRINRDGIPPLTAEITEEQTERAVVSIFQLVQEKIDRQKTG